MSAIGRNNVNVRGRGERAIVFGHGFGCDQAMWRHVAPAFEDRFLTVLFDYVGAGGSELAAYDPRRYATLDGYADDVVDILDELELSDVVFVGHSVSAMIGALASLKAPGRIGKLVMVGPSPRYIDDDSYVGGFAAEQIEELLAFLADNPMAWSQTMAPMIMANGDRPELGQELTASFCRMDPAVARDFARATFTSDNRADLARIQASTLVLQCADDIIASEAVGRFVHDQIPGSKLVLLKATGHCPNLSAPTEVVAAIQAFV